MLIGEASIRNLSGPLTIADYAGQSVQQGLTYYLGFLALVSVSLGVLNLLPLPMLDGGHILLAVLEAVRRQGISARSYIRFQKIGLVVMGTLFVLILANDPLRLVQRQRALGNAPSPAPQEQPVAPP
jgi:regulator of sigma E protease